MFEAVLDLVVEDGAVLWMPHRDGRLRWIRTIFMTHRIGSSSLLAPNEGAVVEPKARASSAVWGADGQSTTAALWRLVHHRMPICTHSEEYAGKPLHSGHALNLPFILATTLA